MIGLTATAYGKESSLEADAIDRLDFRVYRTCDQDLTIDPTVHRSQKIETPFNYAKLIGEQRTLRPVLVLAKGDMFDYLATLAHVTVVTENTPYEELRHLDEKKGIAYSVYVANEQFGWRGVDYRSSKGIALIIGAAFGDPRERI